MPRPRTPLAKAQATGRTIINPGRFKSRKEPKTRPLGDPSAHLDEVAQKCWAGFKTECPWLMESDRTLVEAASMLRASLWVKGMDVKVIAQLRMLINSMGGTPADRSKVALPDDQETDPAEEFLQ